MSDLKLHTTREERADFLFRKIDHAAFACLLARDCNTLENELDRVRLALHRLLLDTSPESNPDDGIQLDAMRRLLEMSEKGRDKLREELLQLRMTMQNERLGCRDEQV